MNEFAPPLTGTKPLCGQDWLYMHQRDHSQTEIDNLTITVIHDGNKLPAVRATNHKEFKKIMRSY